MANQRVRIVDIAEELGVSTATVSNVIHGKTKKISEETLKRVEQLLEERQYIPSMAGILLAQNDSKIIGVVVNDHYKYEKRALQDPFISSALDSLAEEIALRGYFMMIRCTNQPREIVQLGSMWNMAGVIIIGFCEEDYVCIKNQMHIPLVVYDGFGRKSDRFANISIDDFDGGYQMGKFLIQQGHQRILYLADNKLCMDWLRYEGLKKAKEEAWSNELEADCEKDYMVVPMLEKERMEYYLENQEKLKEYTAIFAASDFYAIELMNFLQDHGVKIPKEISVAGFDDIPMAKMVRPALTTIHQDSHLRANLAIQVLLDDQKDSGIDKDVMIPLQLIIRKSVQQIR